MARRHPGTDVSQERFRKGYASVAIVGAHGVRPGDRGPRPAQELRRRGGGQGPRLQRAARRDLRPARAERRGQTSTVEILEGYRQRTSGSVSVLGFDPAERPRALRARVGIVLQSSGIYSQVRVREVLAHFAGFYPHPRDVDEVIDLVGLGEQGETVRGVSRAGSGAGSTSRSRWSATPS